MSTPSKQYRLLCRIFCIVRSLRCLQSVARMRDVFGILLTGFRKSQVNFSNAPTYILREVKSTTIDCYSRVAAGLYNERSS